MNRSFTFVVAFAVAGVVRAAYAQNGEGTPADVENPDVKQRYELLRRSPPAKLAPPPAVTMIEETRVVSEQRIEDVLDGAVLVSRPVDPAVETQLVAMGVRKVDRREDVGHHMIFEGRYYLLLEIAPNGPDEFRLEKARGVTMRMETVQRTDRRTILVSLRN